MSVRENLEYGLRMRRVGRPERARLVADLVEARLRHVLEQPGAPVDNPEIAATYLSLYNCLTRRAVAGACSGFSSTRR
jgi:hypothetical protein